MTITSLPVFADVETGTEATNGFVSYQETTFKSVDELTWSPLNASPYFFDYATASVDENGFYNTMIMSYSVKFASSFYYPFREAACSSPSAGNRKSYQMDPANALEAIREAELDVIEGADFLMVKPALPYLDIIRTIKDEFPMPLVTYNVSGEYSMIMAAIENGYLSEEAIMESLLSIKRAGADLIITNFAPYALDHL